VLIYGDLIEQIPTVTSTEGLEYELTTLIRKMTQKISTLLALEENIEIKLFQSTALDNVAPYIGIRELAAVPEEVEELVRKMNRTHYGRLDFEVINPATEEDVKTVANRYNLLVLSWPELSEGRVPSGQGVIGLVATHGERSIAIPLLKVIRLPIVGTQYQLTNMTELEPILHAEIESLIDVNANLGYLAGHGTLSVSRTPPPSAAGRRPEEAANNLRELISRTYSLKPVNLSEGDLLEGFNCLVIARPLERFTDYELYQIDQFLMRGNNLAVFIDAFEENRQADQAASLGAPPAQFKPLETGLEPLLAHYGVRVKSSYVMDENCFRQEMPARLGGGEQPIYFAPLIKNRNINHDLAVLKNIKSLVALRISPLELDDERTEQFGLTAHRLFSSSEKSWEMKGRINLNPMFIRPPSDPEEMQRYPLAYVLEGSFPSYFEGKPIPVREAKNEPKTEGEPAGATDRDAVSEEKPPEVDRSKIEGSGQFVARGKPGKILVLASGDLLRDNVIDAEGRGANAVFILNMIDYLNGREDVAVMRGKQQRFSPLEETSGMVKTFAKTFNIAGLPALVVVFGLLVWWRRAARKKRIQAMFQRKGGAE
jgi:ABC-type uncharacterized transport system involved in gliding motility auxiliary subunit